MNGLSVVNYDILPILRLSPDLFLPAAFKSVLGRPIDVNGAYFYASRMKKGLPRTVVLAELRSSREGRVYAKKYLSDKLEKIVFYYSIAKNLPFKEERWRLVPNFKISFEKDAAFDWSAWVYEYSKKIHLESLKNKLDQERMISSDWTTSSFNQSKEKFMFFLHKLNLVGLDCAENKPFFEDNYPKKKFKNDTLDKNFLLTDFDFEVFVKLLEEELELHPTSYQIWVVYGYVLNKCGFYDGAKDALNKSLELAPSSDSVFFCLVRLERLNQISREEMLGFG